MKRKKISCLCIGLLLAAGVWAQKDGFQFAAELAPVSETGFYNILLTPAITAHTKTDYSDLRIVNAAGKWVPHLLRFPAGERTNHLAYMILNLVSNKGTTDSSQLIIKTNGKSLSMLRLLARNTGVARWGSLTGSDDSLHWFIIDDSMLLRPVVAAENESEFNLNFAANSYIFYKLSISNKGKAPYAITEANTPVPRGPISPNTELLQNPVPTITQKDSAKTSVIKVMQKASFHVDEIELLIDGPAFFNRMAEVYTPRGKKNKSKVVLANVIISSEKVLRFKIPVFNDSIFFIAINNDDNLPLKIDSVHTYTRTWLATAYLEKNTRYQLLMGNATATLPTYDLQHNDSNVKTMHPFVATGNIVSMRTTQSAKGFWQNNGWVLWLCILSATAVLGFFTFRLIKDMSKMKEPLS